MEDDLMLELERAEAVAEYEATQRRIRTLHVATVSDESRQRAQEIGAELFPRKI